ncbi:hypothetical protein FB567DRAFT_117299 [Paraphoma chrysanthemicola]|uniref:Rhodopsin domain-containing protein n=1 Tax=Paraphoma chrysanthemicola TaxID=798071 RepID=A0A8K0R2K5_9PLEO|nr:hypothetical protein FB567DRAFT_117299 [Paraphoma chrysanthemicola]
MSAYREIISEPQFIRVVYAMVILATAFSLARLGIQVWKRKWMEMQDYLIYFAFVCFLAMSISYLVIVPQIYKIGRVTLGLIEPWPTLLDEVVNYIRMMFVTTTLFWISLWSVKLSLLSLYKKFMEGLPKIYMRLWWALFVFCLISLVGCFVSYLTSCPDFAASLSKGECSGPRSVRGQLASLYTSFAVDVISDFLIMALPINLVWGLQMARSQKLAILALFASGFVRIAFATIRVIQIGMKAGNDTSPSPTWLAMWTIIESAIAICIGCCPAFAAFYRTTRITHISYDTNGYIRHDRSRTGIVRSRTDGVALKPITIINNSSRLSRNEVDWNERTGSQEKLAASSKRTRVTTTLQQDSILTTERYSTSEKENARASMARVAPSSPPRMFFKDHGI